MIFGILHLIGVSVILSVFFFRFKKLNILIGGKLIFLGPPSELKEPKDPIVADFLNPKIDLKHPRFKQLET